MSCKKYRRLSHPLNSYDVVERALLREYEKKIPRSVFTKKPSRGRIRTLENALSAMPQDVKEAIRCKL